MTPVSSLFLMCFERYLKDNLSSCPKRGKRRHTHKWKFSISTREEMRYCCCLCFIAIFGYMGNKFKVILQDVFYNIHPEYLFLKKDAIKTIWSKIIFIISNYQLLIEIIILLIFIEVIEKLYINTILMINM